MSVKIKHKTVIKKPSELEVEEAVRTLIRWAGDNPEREGLQETPRRVMESYREFFSGYDKEPTQLLLKAFSEVDGFDDIILLKKIKFNSFCEHHILPIIGHVDIAYIPSGKIVGISKIARVVEIFSKRLQMQERLTAQIAQCLDKNLNAAGVAVSVVASHKCMTIRGIKSDSSTMQTHYMTGIFRTNLELRNKFISLISV